MNVTRHQNVGYEGRGVFVQKIPQRGQEDVIVLVSCRKNLRVAHDRCGHEEGVTLTSEECSSSQAHLLISLG